MWLYYLIPIIVHLLFLPLWYLTDVSLIEIVVGTVIIPIYLIIISAKSLKGVGIRKFIGALLLMLIVVIVGHLIAYFNWGITTGNLLKPDSETVYIAKLQMIISSIIITIGWTITYLMK